MRLDLWAGLELLGFALLCGGIWAKWGWPWASMAGGCLVLSICFLHAARAARQTHSEE